MELLSLLRIAPTMSPSLLIQIPQFISQASKLPAATLSVLMSQVTSRTVTVHRLVCKLLTTLAIPSLRLMPEIFPLPSQIPQLMPTSLFRQQLVRLGIRISHSLMEQIQLLPANLL